MVVPHWHHAHTRTERTVIKRLRLLGDHRDELGDVGIALLDVDALLEGGVDLFLSSISTAGVEFDSDTVDLHGLAHLRDGRVFFA